MKPFRLLVALLLLTGCGASRTVYLVDPLPPIVHPTGEDWGVDIDVAFSDHILLTLVNSGIEPVAVIWEESAYVDVDNRSHRVMNSEVRRAKRPAAMKPSIVAPGTRLQEVLTPVGHELDTGMDPLLPVKRGSLLLSPNYVGNPVMRRKVSDSVKGKQIGLFLVLERAGQRRTVLANYTISDVKH